MNDLRQSFREILEMIWPFVPPAIGAYFGMLWSEQQSRQERMTAWFCSAFLSLYLGAAIGEYWGLGVKATSGVTIIVAMLLSDILAVVIAAARQWTSDPVGTFRKWRDAWLGRGGDGG
jgi:hypothetical protein